MRFKPVITSERKMVPLGLYWCSIGRESIGFMQHCEIQLAYKLCGRGSAFDKLIKYWVPTRRQFTIHQNHANINRSHRTSLTDYWVLWRHVRGSSLEHCWQYKNEISMAWRSSLIFPDPHFWASQIDTLGNSSQSNLKWWVWKRYNGHGQQTWQNFYRSQQGLQPTTVTKNTYSWYFEEASIIAVHIWNVSFWITTYENRIDDSWVGFKSMAIHWYLFINSKLWPINIASGSKVIGKIRYTL